MWEGENIPHVFHQGRMRDVGRGKVFPPCSHPGKDAGYGKRENVPHFYSSKEGLGMWKAGNCSPFL